MKSSTVSAPTVASSTRKLLPQTMRLPSLPKRQHSHEPTTSQHSAGLAATCSSASNTAGSSLQKCSDKQHPSLSVGDMQDSKSRTSAGPLQQISADEKMSLRPSPKKRAVSRGHHGNIPHPSPVYHCSFSASQCSGAVNATPSCSIAPLELVCHSSTRYQQQRYDPLASRSNAATGTSHRYPRTAASIPSFRGPTLAASTSPSLPSASPYDGGHGNAIPYCSTVAGSGSRRDRYALRHQCTLPDMSARGKDLPTGSSSLCHRHASGPGAVAPTLSSLMPSTASTPLPAPPPPARLASCPYEAESSPVATLVYDQSPALAAAAIGCNNRRQVGHISSVRSRASMASASSSSNPPVSALSALSVNSQQQHFLPPASTKASAHQDTANDDAMPCPAAADDGENAHGTACPSPTERSHHSQTDDDAHGGGGSGGWQLKNRILHPLSSWFRSSKQPQHSHGAKQRQQQQPCLSLSPASSARNGAVSDGSHDASGAASASCLVSRTCSARLFHQGKGSATAAAGRRPGLNKAPDSGMVCSMSPV
ncbi:hypothetical protein GQ54DRAFT_115483 [Martensiomyces pterosporus]|nr:hypothetical protein GQ54DRAFT_115483 [Martensiomyces pterosporus]